MPIRAIFFDLGGVIIRTEYQAPREHLAERLNTTYEDLSRIVFESETSRTASLGQITAEQHWESVARRLGRPVAEAGLIRDEFFAGDVIDIALVDFIRSVRPQVKTGVISNAWPDMRAYAAARRIDDAFDELIISAEVGVMKPDAKIYQLALDKLRVTAQQALFVDDTAPNVEAARELGMHAILFKERGRVLDELKDIME